jgi:hypothetical protein
VDSVSVSRNPYLVGSVSVSRNPYLVGSVSVSRNPCLVGSASMVRLGERLQSAGPAEVIMAEFQQNVDNRLLKARWFPGEWS